jgi:hypothetical protein
MTGHAITRVALTGGGICRVPWCPQASSSVPLLCVSDWRSYFVRVEVGWLRSIFSGKPPRPARPSGGVVGSDNVATRRLILDDAKHIKAALDDLANVGITLSPIAKADLNATAENIAAELDGLCFSMEPTPGHWVLVALNAEPGTFENSICLDDHCYDVALGEYSYMIGEFIALAGDEWRIDSVYIENARHPGAAVDLKQPVRVTIKAEPEVAPFELMHDKDFDWSVVFRLNERLPKGALGRFAILWDGNATIVYLPPENVRQLNSLCGYEFLYEEDPRDQYASSHPTELVEVLKSSNMTVQLGTPVGGRSS